MSDSSDTTPAPDSIDPSSESTPPNQNQALSESMPNPIRLFIAGIFMGLANIVPGVSGGTMILALGLYDDFIGSVARITQPAFWKAILRPSVLVDLLTLKWKKVNAEVGIAAPLVIGILAGTAALTILLLSSLVHYLMETQRYIMYSLFIGMTLGGAPLLYKSLRPFGSMAIMGAITGFFIMAIIAFVLEPSLAKPGWFYLLLGGVVGSTAMVLPGISGSYMLLIMGLYTPIIFGVSEFKDALSDRNISLLIETGWGVLFPVAFGLMLGIAGLSNLLKFLLARYHQVTVGFLFGLLLGSVLGLYPFKAPTFDKLVRYAIPLQEVAIETSGTLTLHVELFGVEAPGHPIEESLKSLENENIVLALKRRAGGDPLTVDDVEFARQTQSVIIAYQMKVPAEVRRDAAREDKDAGIEEVQLLVVPDTAATPGRFAVAGLLVVLGFGATFVLGRGETV
jgi:putative membrane protein